MIIKYLKYFITAKRRGYGVHSPFAYKLAIKLLKDKKNFIKLKKIERLRENLLKSNQKIEVKDFGAGSKKMQNNKRKVREIVKYSATPPKYGKLLSILVNYFEPQTILEIGTSAGIGTLYLSSGNPSAKIYTLEGCPQTAKIAENNFKKFSNNIEIIVGKFDKTLIKTLNKIEKLDFVFIDGNHRKEPTIKYFETILPFCNNDTVIIFDDISWTSQMQEAWQEIKQHKETKLAINIFKMGIIFLRKEFHNKEEVTLYY